jgi:aryl-alcohol dehydrogenase-like predicted oxidoreductase
MRYKLLGKSGLRVSELCLGTMTFGETWGWGAPKEESHKQFDLFANAGGNFIDTSVNYTDGTSEEFLGEFLQSEREHFVIATKYTLTKSDSLDPNSGGNSLKNMRQSVERSLRRLRTDYVDLYYLHMWDYMTPVEEVVRGLDDLVRAGKVLYVGISDTPDWIAAEANTLAQLRGWSRFVALQVPYSLIDRAVERSLLPMARHWDMAVMAWGLLEEGLLSGKFLDSVSQPTRLNPDHVKPSPRVLAIVDEVQKIAEESGRTMAQVAINWVRQQQYKSQMIPILGARTAAQLKDNLAVLEWQLADEHLRRLDEVSKLDMGFPHNFLEGNRNIFGQTFALIDNHRR